MCLMARLNISYDFGDCSSSFFSSRAVRSAMSFRSIVVAAMLISLLHVRSRRPAEGLCGSGAPGDGCVTRKQLHTRVLRITWACVSPHSACLVPLRRGGRAPPGPVPPRGTSECLREHRGSRGTVYSLSPAKCRVRQRFGGFGSRIGIGRRRGCGGRCPSGRKKVAPARRRPPRPRRKGKGGSPILGEPPFKRPIRSPKAPCQAVLLDDEPVRLAGLLEVAAVGRHEGTEVEGALFGHLDRLGETARRFELGGPPGLPVAFDLLLNGHDAGAGGHGAGLDGAAELDLVVNRD